VTESAEVVFDVDASAGVTELADNESVPTATVVASTQSQIAGRIVNVPTPGTTIVTVDYDYYRISLDAGEAVSVDMLANQVDFYFLTVEDANGVQLSNERERVSSYVSNVSFTNGDAPQDVFIRVSSGPVDLETNNQYKLSLEYR